MANRKRSSGRPPESRLAPEPEGPEEISRRFQRMNRKSKLGGLREVLSGPGGKKLYGALAAIAGVTAAGLGLFFNVPFMDIVAVALAGSVLSLLGGKKESAKDGGPEDGEESTFERLLRRLGNPPSNDDDFKGSSGGR